MDSMATKSLTIEVALGDRLNAYERVRALMHDEVLGILASVRGRAPHNGLRTASFRVVTDNLCPVLRRIERAGFPVIRIEP
jgi:hypothetical protein